MRDSDVRIYRSGGCFVTGDERVVLKKEEELFSPPMYKIILPKHTAACTAMPTTSDPDPLSGLMTSLSISSPSGQPTSLSISAMTPTDTPTLVKGVQTPAAPTHNQTKVALPVFDDDLWEKAFDAQKTKDDKRSTRRGMGRELLETSSERADVKLARRVLDTLRAKKGGQKIEMDQGDTDICYFLATVNFFDRVGEGIRHTPEGQLLLLALGRRPDKEKLKEFDVNEKDGQLLLQIRSLLRTVFQTYDSRLPKEFRLKKNPKEDPLDPSREIQWGEPRYMLLSLGTYFIPLPGYMWVIDRTVTIENTSEWSNYMKNVTFRVIGGIACRGDHVVCFTSDGSGNLPPYHWWDTQEPGNQLSLNDVLRDHPIDELLLFTSPLQ
jgi:hypothetical protein